MIKARQLISIASAVCLIGLLSSANAADYPKGCNEKHDRLYCGAVQLTHLNYLGDAVLNGTTVTGSMKIAGDLTIRHSRIGSMNIIGDLKANDSDINGDAVIKGDATLSSVKFRAVTRIVGDLKSSNAEFLNDSYIVGDMDVKNTRFKGRLTLAADKAYMLNSSSFTINFDKSHQSQHLYLNQHSFVNGDVNFPSNRGIVSLSGGSQVSGKINGGKMLNN